MSNNKVKFGLCNVHFSRRSVDEQGNITYATPTPHEGAVSLSITRSKEKSTFRADNKDFYIKWLASSREATLEVSDIKDYVKTAYLGYKIDSNNHLVETDEDGAEFALLFQVETDASNKKYAIFNCKATEGDTEHKTTETNDLGITASPLNIAIGGEDVDGTMCYITEIDSFASLSLPTFTESN